MPRFAANLSMLFTESPLPERVERAAAAGFRGVEMLFPYEEDVDGLAATLRATGLEQVLFNLPAGDFAKGDRGYANDPSRRAEFREGVALALEIAANLGCRRLNCLVGLALANVEPELQWATVAENLVYAADAAAKAGVLQVVEPLNPYDAPGFLLATASRGFALVEEIGHPNLKLQYDIYHAQRTEGNLAATIAAKTDLIGHIQIADSPARHQPGTGEIAWPFVFAAIDASGYDGWVSAEYRPLGRTEHTLEWIRG
jgi:hydroxypyruvate isomerase